MLKTNFAAFANREKHFEQIKKAIWRLEEEEFIPTNCLGQRFSHFSMKQIDLKV